MELGKTLRTLFAAAALAASAGCGHNPDARVRLAEFQDENPDGQAQQDESTRDGTQRTLGEARRAAASYRRGKKR